ncbi:hypothetical protein JAAARDRAFT_199187 [Jaapia argillacea MUCL 33604]|uniref:FAS1 domain-containing protein n=1 Tax=Jaapia argillacea MUCL 33604 TaxID=933084 RepID=A0A067P8V6_9AGAM|nr:hypothetical protein JAAARDRAFT_199187 [Jaapia argillacea MUCL 33604]
MRLTSLIPLLSLGLAKAQSINTTYLNGLLNELTNAGFTSLVSAAASVENTTVGQEILSELSSASNGSTKFTVFVPTNVAFSGVPSNISGDPNVLADVLAYHIVSGNISTNEIASYPNTTIGRTLLNDTNYVALEGGKSQVLAWTKWPNGNTTILNQNTVVNVLSNSVYQNIELYVVDAVIDTPGSLDAALFANNLTALRTVLSSVTEGSGSLFTQLNNTHGFTLFAPTDAAFAAVQSQLTSLGSNMTALQAVLGNHIINGTTAYTPTLMAHNYTSGAGESLNTRANSSGVFVFSGNSTASITKPDLILDNGVVHIIDHVLLNEDSNTGAASSAYSSATSAAAQTSTESGPVGSTPSAPGSSGSSGSGNGSGSKSAAVGMGVGKAWGLVGAGLVLGVLVL